MLIRHTAFMATVVLANMFASQSFAQITLVSQNRSVRADGCTPPLSQSNSAPDFGPFNAGAFVNCPSNPFGVGQANQNSTLSSSSINCSQTATALGNAGSDNTFQVVFDVVSAVEFTFNGTTNRPNFSITLTGPNGDVFPAVTNTTLNTTGSLPSGRYTLTSNMFGQSGNPQPASSLSMTFSTLGSCCLTNGSCSVTTQANCTGVWTAGGTCANPCPPINDLCANALTIGQGSTPFTTMNATTDGPTPQPSCVPAFPNFLRDVWYRYLPEFSGELTVSTCGSADYDSKLSAYTGTCNALNLIGCGEDECGFQSSMTFPVTAGVAVLLRVGGYAEFAMGSGSLNVSQIVTSPYTISWSTIDSGGGKIAAGPYEINTSIGQYDAEQSLSVRTLTLSGGFWTRSPFGLYCDAIDFNNDFSYFDPQDIDAFLSVYSEGPCIPSYATCNDIDFNNDGSLFDPCDIDSYLLVFSEGPCTACGN